MSRSDAHEVVHRHKPRRIFRKPLLFAVLFTVVCGSSLFAHFASPASAAKQAKVARTSGLCPSGANVICNPNASNPSIWQGFDACTEPSVSQMQIWWNDTLYGWVNVYFGGINHPSWCGYPTSSWISQLASQGWRFVPTWDGYAAPCQNNGSANMSYNTSTAYNQGVGDANAAMSAANSLNWPPGSIIYEDMEYFNPYDSSCAAAVNAYINGWDTQLNGSNYLSGIYESASDVSDLVGASINQPNDIWIAGGGCWSSSFNNSCTVWGNYYISNSSWLYDQRLYQYTAGHNETYGGVTLNIDSDVADGVIDGPGGMDNDGDESNEQNSTNEP
jgi:hypothetical protein